MPDESHDTTLLADAVARRNAGDLAGAEARYRQLLERGVRHPVALHDLGVICLVSGRASDAVACFNAALELEPRRAETLNALGAALRAQNDLAAAEKFLEEAIRIAPGFAEARNNLGLVCMSLGQTVRGIACFRKAAESAPGFAQAWANLGHALTSRGDPSGALAPLERACALAPQDARAAAALGVALGLVKRYPEAIAALERARALAPGDVAIGLDLLHVKQQVCDWRGMEEGCSAVRASVASGRERPVSPYFFMMVPGTTAAEQRTCAERWAALVAAEAGAPLPALRGERGTARKLRIGYLAPDLNAHAGTRLLAGVLEHHDRTRFEIMAFASGPRHADAMRARLDPAVGGIIDLSRLDDRAAAEEIRARQVDVLVVREIYTSHTRAGIPALRPAPAQVSFLGYPGTTGAPFIDWLIADPFVVPREARGAYSERIAYLPDSYQCNDDKRPRPAAPARSACGLPEKALVFCCFNQTYKITAEVFDIWCRLLAAVPGSVLWLWASNVWAGENLRAAARARGVDPARLVFAPTVPWDEHIARIGAADLFLDTFPCNAHTTASDALWAGVPVVTCAGETFMSRVAGSVLEAAGLPELVTTSLEDYEKLALELARNRAERQTLRSYLKRELKTTPLFNTARFTRNLEKVYLEIARA